MQRGRTIPNRTDARVRSWSVFTAVAAGIIAAGAFGGSDPLGPLTGHNDLHLSPLLFAAAGLLSALILILPRPAAWTATLLASLLMGAGVSRARLFELPPDHLARLFTHADPADPASLIRLRGLVVDQPSADAAPAGSLDAKLVRYSTPSKAFTLRASSVVTDAGATRVRGTIRVYASGLEDGQIEPGDRVEILGLLRPPRARMNPGESDARAWAMQSGRAGSLLASADTIQNLDAGQSLQAGAAPDAGSPTERMSARIIRLLERRRSHASALLDTERSGSSVVRAMVLGERSPDGREDAAFARTGVSHLLAISGFHLAILVGLTVGAVRIAGDFPRTEAVVGLAVVAGYALLVPARTPILRAALLAAVLLLAHWFYRKWDRLTLLGWVATALIIFRPLDLGTLGFQLTVGVTALLIWLADTAHPWSFGEPTRFAVDQRLLPSRPLPVRALDKIRGLVVTSVLVWALAAPVVIYHTGSLNPLAPIAVIIATPIASAIQVVGMAGVLVRVVSEPLGGVFVDGAHALGSVLGAITLGFDGLGAHRVLPPVSVAWAGSALGVGVFVVVRARLLDWRPWLAVFVVIAWLGVEVRTARTLPSGVAARVDMLSVGDGSCLLVRSGGDAMLWDAGSLTPGLGVRTIPRALRAAGSPRVPTALITHANIDHYAALPDAARSIGLERVFVSAPALATMRASDPGSAERVFLDELALLGVEVRPLSRGDAVPMGGGVLRVLWPPADPPVSIRARNDRSLVARLEIPTDAGERRVLLVGDIQRSAMLLLLDDARSAAGAGTLNAEITELAHHGSHHAVAEEFLRAVGPRVVLQSTGPSRAHDRRWNGMKGELSADLGTWWGITARDGALRAEIGRDGRAWARTAVR